MMAKSGQSIKRFFDIWDMNGFLITPTTTTLKLDVEHNSLSFLHVKIEDWKPWSFHLFCCDKEQIRVE